MKSSNSYFPQASEGPLDALTLTADDERERHQRVRLDYDQQFCRKRFLFLLLDLWTSFVWLILKPSLIKEIWREKSSSLGASCILYHLKHGQTCKKPTHSCITTHSRKYKLPLISRQSYNNLMMETNEAKRRETHSYRIKEYIKLEGTSKY